MATAYGVFANGGYRVNPLLISRSPTSKGQVLHRDASRRCSTNRCARIDARNAFVMNSLLQEVTRSGTAAARAGARSSAPTSTARPAPPTTRSTPGSPASSRPGGGGLDGLRQRRASSATAKPAAAWPAGLDRLHGARAQGRAGRRSRRAPEGVVNVGGEWFYEEYAHGAGVEQPRASKTSRRRRRRPRKSARASSTCSGAERSAGRSGRSAAACPACALAQPTARRRTRAPSRCRSQRPST